MSQDFQYSQIVEAFSVIGKAFGQLFVVILRVGVAYVEGRHPAANTPVTLQPAALDKQAACKYLSIRRTKFDELRKVEDLGEFIDAGRPKFPRDKLDAYLAKQRQRK